GMSMVEILATCPPNWHLEPLQALERLEKEVMKEFPLGEFKNVDKIE
ncbi:MAG: 2-oxoglutarate oxidoreductase, partial [Chloroflexi bacterium]|nr:2-oxoglutarate oxidoreductase [Chloroflexota bacterium]